jgi:RND family efflux transporter MFP subunit
VVCWLDDDEHQQAVHQAEAELTVAKANRTEAEKALEIATRGLTRVETLRERGVASDVQHDQAIADKLAKEAALAVAKAEVTREEAALEAAKIRLGYTLVAATWNDGADTRIVAERYVDEGQTVAANAPLLRIVELDPLVGVVYVTEKDYALLADCPPVKLRTDAYPDEVFEGTITRISPVLRQSTRQARVELRVDNPTLRLRPGMFIRATLVLETVDDATIVPVAAIAERASHKGVFVVDEAGAKVSWHPVTVGIRQGEDLQVTGEGLVGRVVTLGQQLVDDGSAIRIPEAASGDGAAAAASAVEPAPE